MGMDSSLAARVMRLAEAMSRGMLLMTGRKRS